MSMNGRVYVKGLPSTTSDEQFTPSEQKERENTVEKTKSITMQVLESLQRNPVCEFDQLVEDCTNFTWNQIFYEVDRLSRLGQLFLTPVGRGHYSLRLMREGGPMQRNSLEVNPKPAQTPSPHLSQSRNAENSAVSCATAAQPTQTTERLVWITERAYQLYEEQGRQDGHSLEHWLKAEREIQGQ
ncbi:MAG: DUF2934 domain-containing protein [Nitrospiraceae bacterium]